jgi:hypothetical protein
MAWSGLCRANFADKTFGLAMSCAAFEWNFFTFGFIHTKPRNSLGSKSVEKVVLINSNLKTFYEDPVGLNFDPESSNYFDE